VPPGKVAKNKSRWVLSVTEYTLAGLIASVIVAVALVSLGRTVVGEGARPAVVVAALAVGVVGIARTAGWRYAMLPRVRRQTCGVWARRFPARVARMLWGFDLGLVITTRTTYPGVAVLAVLTVALSNAWLAVFLLPAYWIGRSLPVWLGPLLLSSPTSTGTFLDELHLETRFFTRLNQLTLIWIVAWLLVLSQEYVLAA
jgi:hypothetical protein